MNKYRKERTTEWKNCIKSFNEGGGACLRA